MRPVLHHELLCERLRAQGLVQEAVRPGREVVLHVLLGAVGGADAEQPLVALGQQQGHDVGPEEGLAVVLQVLVEDCDVSPGQDHFLEGAHIEGGGPKEVDGVVRQLPLEAVAQELAGHGAVVDEADAQAAGEVHAVARLVYGFRDLQHGAGGRRAVGGLGGLDNAGFQGGGAHDGVVHLRSAWGVGWGCGRCGRLIGVPIRGPIGVPIGGPIRGPIGGPIRGPIGVPIGGPIEGRIRGHIGVPIRGPYWGAY